jgi:SAM-dependent methyltransferase
MTYDDRMPAKEDELALFEQINAEYRERPLKPKPVLRDRQSAQDKAQRRIGVITRQLGMELTGARVLELGCGQAWLTAYLPSLAGADEAIGVDVRRYPAWDEHTDPHVRLIQADMSVEEVVAPGSVDVVVSGAVFEHVERPLEMLAAVHRSLRDGGKAWLYFNLYRGPQASHRYNEVFFPWPHLLFDNDTCREFYKRHHGKGNVKFAWVNHLTLAHYLLLCHEIGFGVLAVHRRVTPIDIPFFRRFEERLSRYPALDLETDFATLVLEKGDGPWPLPSAGYLERQREFDAALASAEPAGAPAVD